MLAVEVKAAAPEPAAPVATKVGIAFATGPAMDTLRDEVFAQLVAHGVHDHVTYVVWEKYLASYFSSVEIQLKTHHIGSRHSSVAICCSILGATHSL